MNPYFHDAPVDEVVTQADLSAQVTHSHPEGRAGAVAVALAAWLAARSRTDTAPPGGPDLLRAVADRLPADLAVGANVRKAADLRPDTPLPSAVAELGNGSRISCQDSVPLALWLALNHLDSYERAVRKAIAAGGDTDTIAAMVGGIVAAHAGADGIPQRWLSHVEPLLTTEAR